MSKMNSNIAATPVTKGSDGADWLRFLQDTGEVTRRVDGTLDRQDPGWNQEAVSLSAAPAKQPAKQRAATAAARGRGAKAGKLFTARRES